MDSECIKNCWKTINVINIDEKFAIIKYENCVIIRYLILFYQSQLSNVLFIHFYCYLFNLAFAGKLLFRISLIHFYC